MVYIRKDKDGKINGVSAGPQSDYTETAEPDDPDVLAYLAPPPPEPTPQEIIAALDAKDKGDAKPWNALVAKNEA